MKLGTHTNKDIYLNLNYLNRHGVITGATGTGKTTTIKRIIEILQLNGIPTFVTDVKGDFSSIAQKDDNSDYLPINLLDFYGKQGKQTHISFNDLGTDSITDLLKLSSAQSDVLAISFLYARDEDYSMNTLDDVMYILNILYEMDEETRESYGYVSKMSIGALIRKLQRVRLDGNHDIFNKTNISPLSIINSNRINIIDGKIAKHATLYAALMTYIVKQFYFNLEEVGNSDKPKAVIFIDEAHVLFKNISKKNRDDFIAVIKLIRSKGIGIIFISQMLSDIPNEVLSQLGLKIQHGLNINNETDLKNVTTVAKTFTLDKDKRTDIIQTISTLGMGHVVMQQLADNGNETIFNMKIDMPKCKNGVLSQQYINKYMEQFIEYKTPNELNDEIRYYQPEYEHNADGYKPRKSLFARIKEALK